MIVNPHGLYIKWQVLLINLYCHIIAVYVRGVVSLCSEHALRSWGLSVGEMKGGQRDQMSTCFTACVLPPGWLFP